MRIMNDEAYKAKSRAVFFHANPLVELVASLHVLADPQHHEHCKQWAIQSMSSLNRALNNDIVSFSINFNQWLFVMDIVTSIACDNWAENARESDIENDLSKFKEMDNFEFAYLFLGCGALHIHRDLLEKWIAAPDNIRREELEPVTQSINEKNVKLFLANIDIYKKKLADIIEKYWQIAFKKNWLQIMPYMVAVMNRQQEIASKMDVMDYVLGINDDVGIDKEKLVFNKEIYYEMELDTIDHVHIFPSAFTAPHFMMDIHNQKVVLYYNLDYFTEIYQNAAPVELLASLKALSDESRLKILKMLWEEKATTQTLSQHLNLAASTISVHLRIMREAGLVKSKQDKKYVYYEIDRTILDGLFDCLLEYFNS